ncbi:MAG: DUF3857 domain-containing protein [Bacteroidota bacterium]
MNLKRDYIAIALTLLMSLALGNAYAQSYEKYDWEEDRKAFKLSEAELSTPLLNLKRHTQYEYSYDESKRNLITYYTQHNIVKAGNDEALEKSNRIYISTSGVIDIVNVKARTINPDGTVKVLDSNNIKEVEDEESGGGFKIFAIEGAEVGSEIEYVYTKKMQSGYFKREYYQFGNPIRDASFKLICPENLEFDFKSYNGLPNVEQIDTVDTGNTYVMKASNIPLIRRENFSAYNANRMRVDFKLAYNSYAGRGRLFTWSDAAKRIHSLIYPFEKAEEKVLAKLFKQAKVNAAAPVRDQVAAIEHYVKTNFYYEEKSPEGADRISFIADNKFGNKRGITRLFVGLFDQAGIKHEIVLTEDREQVKFDKGFDTWNYLNEYVIYISDADTYLAPYSFEYRLGLIPPELTATNGLFIKSMKVRDFEVPVGQVKYIPALGYKENMDNLSVEVNFDKSLTKTEVNMTRSFGGYTASAMKAVYPLLEDDRKKEMLEGVVKFLAVDAEVEEVDLTQDKWDFKDWNKAFEVSGKFTTPSYLEQAGDVLLFKIGELIGPQSELYQDEERLTEVENDFNRGYLRKITVNIPKGYSIQNPDDLKIDEEAKEGDKTIFKFISTYQIENNKLKIEISEYYDQIYYPLDGFEAFRKVINAAADWNKITLILKKS